MLGYLNELLLAQWCRRSSCHPLSHVIAFANSWGYQIMSTQLHSFLFTRVSLHFQMTRFYYRKIFIYFIYYVLFIIYLFIYLFYCYYYYIFFGGEGGGGGKGDCFFLFCFVSNVKMRRYTLCLQQVNYLTWGNKEMCALCRYEQAWVRIVSLWESIGVHCVSGSKHGCALCQWKQAWVCIVSVEASMGVHCVSGSKNECTLCQWKQAWMCIVPLEASMRILYKAWLPKQGHVK